MSGEARYSQPLPAKPRDVSGPVLRAGFVGHGASKEPGFIFRSENGNVERQEVTAENRANERPRGFFASLARLMFGG
jgi:hypothetical protein